MFRIRGGKNKTYLAFPDGQLIGIVRSKDNQFYIKDRVEGYPSLSCIAQSGAYTLFDTFSPSGRLLEEGELKDYEVGVFNELIECNRNLLEHSPLDTFHVNARDASKIAQSAILYLKAQPRGILCEISSDGAGGVYFKFDAKGSGGGNSGAKAGSGNVLNESGGVCSFSAQISSSSYSEFTYSYHIWSVAKFPKEDCICGVDEKGVLSMTVMDSHRTYYYQPAQN